MPALITVIGELNTPRYPVMGNLLSACLPRAPIKIWNAGDIGVKTDEVGLSGSLTQVIKTFAPKGKRKSEIIDGSPKEAVSKLIEKLKAGHLI